MMNVVRKKYTLILPLNTVFFHWAQTLSLECSHTLWLIVTVLLLNVSSRSCFLFSFYALFLLNQSIIIAHKQLCAWISTTDPLHRDKSNTVLPEARKETTLLSGANKGTTTLWPWGFTCSSFAKLPRLNPRRQMHSVEIKLQQRTIYTPNAVVELLPHRHCVGATLIAP